MWVYKSKSTQYPINNKFRIYIYGESLLSTHFGGIPPNWVGDTTQKLTCVLVMCIAHDQLNSPLTPLLSLSTVKPSNFFFFSLIIDSSADPNIP